MCTVFTSYFGNQNALRSNEIVPISIARWSPKWFNGATFQELAPLSFILKNNLSEEEYIRCYHRYVLDRLDAKFVIEHLKRIGNGKDVAICCYEKPGDFCHRHIAAKWLTEKTGEHVEEFKVPTKAEEPQKPKLIQLSLF